MLTLPPIEEQASSSNRGMAAPPRNRPLSVEQPLRIPDSNELHKRRVGLVDECKPFEPSQIMTVSSEQVPKTIAECLTVESSESEEEHTTVSQESLIHFASQE